jgi:hypothetical protein
MVAAVVIELARGQEKGRCSSQGDPLFARCARYETDWKPTVPPSRFYQLRRRLGKVVMDVTVGVKVLPCHSL